MPSNVRDGLCSNRSHVEVASFKKQSGHPALCLSKDRDLLSGRVFPSVV